MELKDMILSTLAELDEVVKQEPHMQEGIKTSNTIASFHEERISIEESIESLEEAMDEPVNAVIDDQKQFLQNLRERILVLFEGFQSPNNKNIEAKIDLTLNFLEYLLATIDEHLESMDKPKK